MTSTYIKNIDDLRTEIARLEIAKQQQGEKLKLRFNSPSAIFGTISSAFGGPSSVGGLKQNFVGMISRVALPFVLNKTLFKKSNFIVKGLVGLVSQKAAGFIDEGTVTNVVDKAKALLAKIGIGKKNPAPDTDQRLPYSETLS
ncbi:hypothetical protein DJ568_06185 [Mucilaginibacter hurinus]|uniref:Uncharacterized protein n=1 Tax=Mucilaginibacter hurinus TaxID=2201324 RepID=A0A367GPU2_9SPHI|nr:hypothetical protein [Mucilaginibacter hurinus]RCH55479.1 hypothetical protein DJ568_06185 [Mucilaginibacter hurinus]